MVEITDRGKQAIAGVARDQGLSEAAVMALLTALQAGHGRAAQFNHPELGGMGQWSGGGMLQIGDMFNDALKAKVRGACEALSRLLADRGLFAETNEPRSYNPDGSHWWPDGLGVPSATGGQNDAQYALFPDRRRLAVKSGETVRVYDTGDHQIGGFSQDQGGGAGRLRFSSQHGSISTADLKAVD